MEGPAPSADMSRQVTCEVPIVRGNCEKEPDTVRLSQTSQFKGANVIDDCSDWMSFHDAIVHVEATQKCYEGLAIKLLQQAADTLEIRSRTVADSPAWVVSGDKRYLNDGKDLQFSREDVFKKWSERKDAATAKRRSRRGTGVFSHSMDLAVKDLWPDGIPEGLTAKDQDEQVRQWLIRNNKSVPADIAKARQRALNRARSLHERGRPE